MAHIIQMLERNARRNPQCEALVYGEQRLTYRQLDAVVNRTELAMPPSITLEMAKGFTLYMVKAVIGGRADEVIDLAKTNLWR